MLNLHISFAEMALRPELLQGIEEYGSVLLPCGCHEVLNPLFQIRTPF
jgi:hypothetical protein